MTVPNVGGTATRTPAPETTGLNPAALEEDLDLRIERLEHLVAGLGLALERLHGGGAAFGATAFFDFDDSEAGNETLDVLFASTADAQRDLIVLRRDHEALVAPTDARSEPARRARLGRLGTAATELAVRFEEHRREIGASTPPRSPGGVVRLYEFVGMVVRVLRDIAEVMDGLRREEPYIGLAVVAATRPHVAPTGPPGRHRTTSLPPFVAVAGQLLRALRRRRTRLVLESAGLVVVALVVIVSAMGEGGRAPGSVTGPGSEGAGPGRTADAGVAVGGGSPTPGASTEGGPSGAPLTPSPSSGLPGPTSPAVTPRPTSPPATPRPPTGATRFNDRIVTATGSIDGLLSTISAAVQDSDLPTAKAGAAEVATIAMTERSWLLAHPAQACYAAFQASAVASYGELIETASAIAQDADAGDGNAIHQEVGTSHGDVSALRQAGSKAVTACA